MYGIVLRNFQKRIQNVYKTYSFRIQISYRATGPQLDYSPEGGLISLSDRPYLERQYADETVRTKDSNSHKAKADVYFFIFIFIYFFELLEE